MIKKTLLMALGLFFLWSPPGFPKSVRFGETLCEDPRYTCQEIQEGETWKSLWPDPDQRDLVMRLNRMNVRLRKGMTIAVPAKLPALGRLDLSPFPLKIDPPGEKQIQVNLSLLAWGAYDAEGHLMDWGPASGGKAWCPDVGYRCRTPAGEYQVFQKKGRRCKSSKFPIPKGGAPMPYCMHFQAQGYALHGSYEVPGYNASHGCVRLFPEDAKWLNENFVDLPNETNEFKGTRVLLPSYTDPALEKPETPLKVSHAPSSQSPVESRP